MYRELPVWSRTGKALDSIVRAGAVGGLTSDEVRACIGDEGALRALRLRVDRSGAGAGVRSTPTFMVNGRIVKVGSMSLAELDAAIAKASKR